MAYGNSKDLTRRTASDKILCDKAFNIAKSPKYDKYQSGLASKVYKVLRAQINFLIVVLKTRICQTSN